MEMDKLEYEKPKLGTKRFSDHNWENVFQPVAKKPPHQVNSGSSSPTPRDMAGNHFTFKDLQRCLYGQNVIRAINIKKPAVTRKNDECFWCDASATIPDFQCPRHKHGTPASQQTSQLPLALRSLPPEVSLCMSSIPGAGCGICAKRKIPVGAWIGPYEGNFVKPEEVSLSTDTSYMWEIFQEGKLSGYTDGSDLTVTSWMRFIRCARHKQEQNLYAFQYLGRVFYRAFKAILPGEEMLVWYDEKYPQYLGIPWTIFDIGTVIPRGVSSQPDEVIVVSPYKNNDQPLNTNTQDSFFPSPPPSPLSNPRSPLKPTVVSLNSKLGLESASYTKSVSKRRDSRLKQNNKNPAIDTQQTVYRPAFSASEKETLVMNSVSETTVRPNLWSRGQSPESSQTDVSFQNPQPLYHSVSSDNQGCTHAVIQARKKPFMCGYCSSSFDGAATLDTHIRLHHCRSGRLVTRETSG